MGKIRIRDLGWKKIVYGIRDRHPGSRTLVPASVAKLGHLRILVQRWLCRKIASKKIQTHHPGSVGLAEETDVIGPGLAHSTLLLHTLEGGLSARRVICHLKEQVLVE
jgi:hypothetical protein